MGKQTDLEEQIKEIKREHLERYANFSEFASEWVKKRFTPFTIDDIKKAFTGAGNALNFDGSTYGALIKDLAQKKRILKNGYHEGIRHNGKKKIVVQWISAEYHQKQANNATKDKSLKLDL